MPPTTHTPGAKSPPVPKPIELKSTVLENQDALPGTENDDPKKSHRVPSATYPELPQTPLNNNYCMMSDKERNEDKQPPLTPGWKSDDDSYCWYCSNPKKFSYNRSPTIERNDAFLHHFRIHP